MKLHLLLLISIFSSIINATPIRTYAQLVQFIKQNKIKSIDELLPHLDSSLLSNYMLPYSSNSPQKSSLEKPRVILTNEKSDFTLAFEGDPKSPSGQVLEIVERNSKNKQLEFSKIDFNQPSSSMYSHKDSSCIACHGKKLKNGKIHMNYIWDSYPDWVGIYGSSHNGSSNRTRYGASSNTIPEFEQNAFLKFQTTAKKNSRYKLLLGIDKISVEDLAHLNSEQTRVFRKINYQNLAQKMLLHPQFNQYQGHFYNMSLNTIAEDKPDYFTKNLSPQLKKDYIEYKKKNASTIEENLEKYRQTIITRAHQLNIKNNDSKKVFKIDSYNTSDKNEITQLGFMLEKLGINLSNISQTKPKRGLDFRGPGSTLSKTEIWEVLLEAGLNIKLPQLNNFKFFYTYNFNIYKILTSPANQNEHKIIESNIRSLHSSKTAKEYFAYLELIESNHNEYLNISFSQTKEHLFSIGVTIEELNNLANSRFISNINKYKLKDQALKLAKTIPEFLNSLKIFHNDDSKRVEIIDKLFSKYYDKFLRLNPSNDDLINLERHIELRPQLAADIYDRLSKSFKSADDFVQYFIDIHNLNYSDRARMQFFRSKILDIDVVKYLPQMSFSKQEELLATELFLPNTIRNLLSEIFMNIKSNDDFSNFKALEKSQFPLNFAHLKTYPKNSLLKFYHQSLVINNKSNFVKIFNLSHDFNQDERPLLKIILDNFFTENIDKYLKQMNIQDIKILVNNSILSDIAHQQVAIHALANIKTQKELSSFQFRKDMPHDFHQFHQALIKRLSRWHQLKCMGSLIKNLINKLKPPAKH